MLAKRIIPCLDVTGGRVVKGVNFVELRDAGDPVEIAARYNEQGADELTFLDITATSDGRDLILHIIEAVAAQIFIPLTVGGGVQHGRGRPPAAECRRRQDQFQFGGHCQSRRDQRRVPTKYGAQCIVVAIDAKRRAGDDLAARGDGWDVYSHGGPPQHRPGCRAMGRRHGAPGRRRDPPHQHGPRRHQGPVSTWP
jgi:cyclase